MLTCTLEESRRVIAGHAGGVFYDLAGHMLDQIVSLLGRPAEVTAFHRHDGDVVPGLGDNTLGVFANPRALALVDMAAMDRRRWRGGSRCAAAAAAPSSSLSGRRARSGFACSRRQKKNIFLPVPVQSRQALYEAELVAFLDAIRGIRPTSRAPTSCWSRKRSSGRPASAPPEWKGYYFCWARRRASPSAIPKPVLLLVASCM